MYLLIFYVPESHLETVKSALFKKGAGKYNKYDCCSWETAGQGQFRPLEGSQPFIGKKDTIEKVQEYKVELICEHGCIHEVIEELFRVHPYEEPAYSIIETKNHLFN
ncbi:MAG: NGG1p interacting factor NIF3 [Chitinispirillia bacterium]